MKELKFRPNTDVHDYQVRLRNARKFLNKVKGMLLVIKDSGCVLVLDTQCAVLCCLTSKSASAGGQSQADNAIQGPRDGVSECGKRDV